MTGEGVTGRDPIVSLGLILRSRCKRRLEGGSGEP
jgi:hypothetical protein